MPEKEQKIKKEIIICIFVIIAVIVIGIKVFVPMFLPDNCRVMTTSDNTRITTFGPEQCVVELADDSAAMYQADESTEGLYQQTMLLRGEMPDTITFKNMLLDDVKVTQTVNLLNKATLADCFSPSFNIIGKSKEEAKKILQKKGTVFEVSQETLPEVMKGGIRYGLDMQDNENHTAVLAYANENGKIDSVQLTVASQSSAKIADNIIRIHRIERNSHKASQFSFSKRNYFFNKTDEYTDVFYLKDGTLTIKYDIALGNYIIYEFRTYGSMNQGFQGAFKTDKENVYAESLITGNTEE